MEFLLTIQSGHDQGKTFYYVLEKLLIFSSLSTSLVTVIFIRLTCVLNFAASLTYEPDFWVK